MTDKVVGKALPVLTKMSQKYFLRKLSYFSQGSDPNLKYGSFLYHRSTFIRNFKEFFPQYSQDKHLVDEFMTWLAREKLKEKELWGEYGRFVVQNINLYQNKALVKVAELMEQQEAIPEGFTQQLEMRMVDSLQSLSTKELATVWRLTKSDAVLKKLKDEERIIINTEYDLLFFTSVFLSKLALFPDIVDLLLSQTIRILPHMSSVPTLCQVLKQYSIYGVTLPNHAFSAIETSILRAGESLRPLDVSEILITMRTSTYFHRVSQHFWEQFEAKIIANIGNFEPSWLLNTVSRYQFPSAEILSNCVPLWIAAVENGRSSSTFREGFCAIAKFAEVDEPTKAWCITKISELKEKFTAFDASTMLRATIAPGWYDAAIWKPLLERFFGKTVKAPRDIDKAMVYFSIKALEIEQVQIVEIESIVREKQEMLREAFERERFRPKNIAVHANVKKALQEMQVNFSEFKAVCEIYNANFIIETDKIVVMCQEWPYHLTAGSKKLTAGSQMLLRHFNKSGYKTVLIANDTDILTHLQDVLKRAQTATNTANFQIV